MFVDVFVVNNVVEVVDYVWLYVVVFVLLFCIDFMCCLWCVVVDGGEIEIVLDVGVIFIFGM